MKRNLLLLLGSAAALLRATAGFGQVAPALGSASSFALFTAVGAFDNVGPSLINGDIGTNAGAFSGFPLGVVNGSINVANPASTQAATDVQAAYGYLAGLTYVVPLAVYGGPVSNPQVLTPNSYVVGAATTLAGNLILDAQNDPNARFFLRVSGALTTGANSKVTLVNGAVASNVYWLVTGRTDLGQNSLFQGTLLVDGAINMIQGASLLGRGLSRSGAITLDTNTASLPLPTANFWLGGRTTDWFTASNWALGVPTSTLDAVVPTGTSPYPVIGAGGSAVAKSVSIAAGASLTQNGGLLDVKGSFINNGTVRATAGAVRLSGTATQALGGNGSTQFWDLTLTNSAGATQVGAMSVHGALALLGGNLSTGSQPLTLLSDAAGTALVNNAGGTVNGVVTMQRYIDPSLNAGTGYRHYSSPVSGAVLSALVTTGFAPVFNLTYNSAVLAQQVTNFPTVFGYDQGRLVSSPATDLSVFDRGYFSPLATDPLAVLSGYSVNLSANAVVALSGPLNNGPLSRTGLSRGPGADAGWQLLGNPYPSPIDLSQTAGITRANLDDAVYVYQSSGPYAGKYRSYVNGMGNPLVASMQGFFVRVSAGQTTGSFGLTNTVRATSTTPAPSFNRAGSDPRPLVQLRLQSGSPASSSLADDTYVYFEQGATADFDARFDAVKLPNSSGLSVSTLLAGQDFSVSGLAPLTPLTGLVTVPLRVAVPSAGTYTLTAASLLNFSATTPVLLLDTQTGARIDLSQQSAYTFQATTTTLPGRFSLAFGQAGPLASQNARLSQQVQLFPNPAHGGFTLLLPAELGQQAVVVQVLNQLGQQVAARTVPMTAAGASTGFDTSVLAPGIYSLRLMSAKGLVVKRVVVE